MRCICYVLCTKYHKQEYDCALLELMARNSPDKEVQDLRFFFVFLSKLNCLFDGIHTFL